MIRSTLPASRGAASILLALLVASPLRAAELRGRIIDAVISLVSVLAIGNSVIIVVDVLCVGSAIIIHIVIGVFFLKRF